MKRTVFIIILMLMSVAAWGAKRLPSWMHELPKPGNNTIMYVRQMGEGRTYTEAHNQALLMVMQHTADRLGRYFDIRTVDSALSVGVKIQTISRQYNIPINEVDYYRGKQNDTSCFYWVLCQVAVAGNIVPQWETLRREGESNNWIAFVKSMFVPGLGQMGKGYYAEGALTLTGELLFVGAGTGCYYMARHQLEVLRDPVTSYADWNRASNAYNTLRVTSYIAWGCAAGLYIFNLYRAYSMQPRRADVVFAPSVIPTENGYAPSLSLTYNF